MRAQSTIELHIGSSCTVCVDTVSLHIELHIDSLYTVCTDTILLYPICNCAVTGHVPVELCHLAMLQLLGLKNNRFEGEC